MTKKEAKDELNRMFSDCIDQHPMRAMEQYEKYCMAIVKAIAALEHDKPYGHWIKHENRKLGKCMKITYECSICGRFAGCEYYVRRSFCPNCGADMRYGEDEGETEPGGRIGERVMPVGFDSPIEELGHDAQKQTEERIRADEREKIIDRVISITSKREKEVQGADLSFSDKILLLSELFGLRATICKLYRDKDKTE